MPNFRHVDPLIRRNQMRRNALLVLAARLDSVRPSDGGAIGRQGLFSHPCNHRARHVHAIEPSRSHGSRSTGARTPQAIGLAREVGVRRAQIGRVTQGWRNHPSTTLAKWYQPKGNTSVFVYVFVFVFVFIYVFSSNTYSAGSRRGG